MMKKLALALGLSALSFSVPASAQTYPTRPITMIVPFGASGPIDLLARIMVEPMKQALGQPIVIENVVGASGTIGVTKVVRSAPDGYTIGIGNWPSYVVASITHSVPYDVLADLEPIAMLPSNPYVLVGRPTLPAKDLKEWIAWLKANPDKATQGTAGIGSGQHVSGVYFQQSTGTKYQFVPYRVGSADIMRDVVGGHIDFTFEQAISSLNFINSGRVKGYAVTSKTRLAAGPDIPSVDEVGAPGVYINTWYGLWAPKGTPRAVLDKIAAAARHALADPEVRKKIIDSGQEIPDASQQNPDALRAHHKAEMDKWTPIIRNAGIKVQ